MGTRTLLSLALGITLAGVLCATGCGGGTPTPAVTVTVTARPTTTPTPIASQRADLVTYIANVQPVVGKVLAQLDRLSKSKNPNISTYPDATWVKLERWYTEYGQVTTNAAIKLALITPPPALRQAHRWLVDSFRLPEYGCEKYISAMRTVTTNVELNPYTDKLNASSDYDVNLFSQWMYALRVQGARLGVHVPVWQVQP